MHMRHMHMYIIIMFALSFFMRLLSFPRIFVYAGMVDPNESFVKPHFSFLRFCRKFISDNAFTCALLRQI